MNRQALFACASCDTTGPAGVCLACSLICHKNCELYELYTKRLAESFYDPTILIFLHL